MLTFEDVVAALKTVCKETDSILLTVLPKWILGYCKEQKLRVFTVLKILLNASESGEDSLGHSNSYHYEDKIKCIEKQTRGQHENTNWNVFSYYCL